MKPLLLAFALVASPLVACSARDTLGTTPRDAGAHVDAFVPSDLDATLELDAGPPDTATDAPASDAPIVDAGTDAPPDDAGPGPYPIRVHGDALDRWNDGLVLLAIVDPETQARQTLGAGWIIDGHVDFARTGVLTRGESYEFRLFADGNGIELTCDAPEDGLFLRSVTNVEGPVELELPSDADVIENRAAFCAFFPFRYDRNESGCTNFDDAAPIFGTRGMTGEPGELFAEGDVNFSGTIDDQDIRDVVYNQRCAIEGDAGAP